MKKLTLLVALAFICMNSFAQSTNDTTVQKKRTDTIRIGNIIIIKRKKSDDNKSGIEITNENKTAEGSKKKKSRLSTDWAVIDLGFANYDDQTNYANAGSYLVNRPGYPALSANDFKLRSGKSINVNIWFFMQKLNLIKENVNLKYGLGLELNNYRFRSDISFKEDGPIPYSVSNAISNAPFIFRDSVSFTKNKLAADYLTIPLMLNFSTSHSSRKKQFQVSVGVSAGYLYSSRNKQRSEARGKETNKGDYDLERFKFSYVGEIGLGRLKLYASYSPNSIFENSLNMRPYNFGFRIGN
jgi:hypothetical protein